MIGARSHRHVLAEELPGHLDCWRVARSMDDERHLFLLDGGRAGGELGRHSVLAGQPRWELVAKDGLVRCGPPGQARPLAGGVLDVLERTLQAFAEPVTVSGAAHDLPPAFTGGAVGFLAYELLHEIEVVRVSRAEDVGVADCHLLFCDVALVSDRVGARSWLVANGWGDSPQDSRRDCLANMRRARAACARARDERDRAGGAERLVASLAGGIVRRRRGRLTSEDLERQGVAAVTEPSRYLELVERARQRILAGDVFQVCLTQRFDAGLQARGTDLYATMRALNPAPMGAYLRVPELEVLSCSPERFLRLDGERWVETRPIKGTRPRGHTPAQDAALALDLATAAKDAAENTMIVDVARNDLGRVCEPGTVTVPRLHALEAHPSLFQLVSTVRGRLREHATPVELLRATFPGCSMTGAPKVQAMRLIAAMEDSRRGIYAGAIGYFNYSGELDLSIVIRTIVKRGERICFHAGGAVTADSLPADEHQEALDKARALVEAIELTRALRGQARRRAAVMGAAGFAPATSRL